MPALSLVFLAVVVTSLRVPLSIPLLPDLQPHSLTPHALSLSLLSPLSLLLSNPFSLSYPVSNPFSLSLLLSPSWTSALGAQELRVSRRPYVPYRLYNGCGLRLWVTKMLDTRRDTEVLVVDPEETVDIHFLNAVDKQRHAASHGMAVHKLAVRVEGYREARTLIIVDRVGTFVHLIQSDTRDLPKTHIVADVTLEEGRKHVSLRSGLVICNKTSVPLELRMDGIDASDSLTLPTLVPQATLAVPVHMTSRNIRLRPHHWGLRWSEEAVSWQASMIKPSRRGMGWQLHCEPIGQVDRTEAFYCCGSLIHDAVPAEHRSLPCHTLTLLPPLALCNLLPYDMVYSLPEMNMSGTLAPGETVGLYAANLAQDHTLRIKVAHFQQSAPAVINRAGRGLSGVDSHVSMMDGRHRTLSLRLINQRARSAGGAKIVSVVADFWFVNRTGLPLLFQTHSGGDTLPGTPLPTDEDALASASPLLVSFSDFGRRSGAGSSGSGDAPGGSASRGSATGDTAGNVSSSSSPRNGSAAGVGTQCVVSVGQHSDRQPLPIDVSGTEGSLGAIQARDAQGQPLSRFYMLGMEVSRGNGRFARTRIVTLVPSFTLVNATGRSLLFHQEGVNHEGSLARLEPGAKQAYHWPNVRAAHHLTARFMDESGQQWTWTHSFPIDTLGTYHIKLYRRRSAEAHLVRVDVWLHGPAREVVFTDATSSPPFRLENRSRVALVYHQVGCSSVFELEAGTTAPYAWDSLSKPLSLRVREHSAPDGYAALYELQRLDEGPPLRYPQYFLIRTAGGLVVSASARMVAEPNFIAACLDEAKPHDPHQLWDLKANGRLVNKAGYQLEATTRGLTNAQVMLRRVTTGVPSPRERWKFEQGRLLSQQVVISSSRASLAGAPYALQVLVPVGRAPQVGDAFVVNVAPTTRHVAEQVRHGSERKRGGGGDDSAEGGSLENRKRQR